MATSSLSFETFSNIIDGELVGSAVTSRTVNPATLEENAEVPLSTVDDVNKAVRVAQRAAKVWAEVSWNDRKAALEKFAQALEEHKEEFARMLNKEQGKSVRIPLQHKCISPLIYMLDFLGTIRTHQFCGTPKGNLSAFITRRDYRRHPTGENNYPL